MLKFALVRWIEDESVGVMPLSAAKKDSSVFQGAIVEMKYKITMLKYLKFLVGRGFCCVADIMFYLHL